MRAFFKSASLNRSFFAETERIGTERLHRNRAGEGDKATWRKGDKATGREEKWTAEQSSYLSPGRQVAKSPCRSSIGQNDPI